MPTPAIPTELVEGIIDHAPTDQALKCCSLVATNWRPRALMHLFRGVRVQGHLSKMQTSGAWRIVHCDRFALFLDVAPHLASLVRELALDAESMTCPQFQDVLLAILQRQSFVSFHLTIERLALRSTTRLHYTTAEFARAKLPIAFPSVRRLELEHLAMAAADILETLVAFPRLEELRVRTGDHRDRRDHYGRWPDALPCSLHLPNLRILVVAVDDYDCFCDWPHALQMLKDRAPNVIRVELDTVLSQTALFHALSPDALGWIGHLVIELVSSSPRPVTLELTCSPAAGA